MGFPMSVQLGHWGFGSSEMGHACSDNAPLLDERLPGAKVFSSHGLAVVHQGLVPVTVKMAPGQQPTFLFWDGRLDNRNEITSELDGRVNAASGDHEIVAAAYARWQTDSFRRLVGDWSLTIWNPRARSLILAKDPVGLRPLFYNYTKANLLWSSSLNLLVAEAHGTLDLDFEYLAGWLSFFPEAHLTPYRSIHAVPPSSFVRFEHGRVSVTRYWDFDPDKQIRYANAFDYEEHFREVLGNAVRRRLRSDKPLLAELSGGMDSSSIVSLADAMMKHEQGLAPRLDTLSYYDDAEPNWNEVPYLTKVEERRGRTGHRIQVDCADDLSAILDHTSFAATPSECGKNSARNREVELLTATGDYGGILSGTGGDEFTGGVPTAVPELANLLAQFRLVAFSRRLKTWALSQRKTWFQLLWESSRVFLPNRFLRALPNQRPPGWLVPRFARLHASALAGYDVRLKFLGPRPSFQENLSAVQGLRRYVACSIISPRTGCERRYPYLDRDLLEFLFAIPREELIEPGRRRSLMRRALAGIVPDEILTRKRKAYVSRGPRVAIAKQFTQLRPLTENMIAESLGIVSANRFVAVLEDLRLGKEAPLVPVLRTLVLERWLRNLASQDILNSIPREPIGEYLKAEAAPRVNARVSAG
jgi:asparagine synthase (glutamine-hydrolysing)